MLNKKKQPKIATIAFHRAINYGALLQVYALQNKIEDLGGECTVLDYRNDLLESKHKKMKLSYCKTIVDLRRYIFLSKGNNRKYEQFRLFSNYYLNLSKPYEVLEELKKDEKKYDKFITGSDQVWNGAITDLDPAFFLNFIDGVSKKNSYAASFGFDNIPEEHRKQYYNMLKDYNYISVRESQGANIIKNLVNRDVPVVLDPTLLISKEKWYELCIDYTKHEKYILIYGFGRCENLIKIAKILSKKKRCKIVHIANPYFKKIGCKYERAPGPREFLGLFKNAEYILTNSFHGTAFSINFNKEFFVELLQHGQNVNSRLENILTLFGLEERQIFSNDISISENSIDYGKVNKVLDLERNRSIEFLNKLIFE